VGGESRNPRIVSVESRSRRRPLTPVKPVAAAAILLLADFTALLVWITRRSLDATQRKAGIAGQALETSVRHADIAECWATRRARNGQTAWGWDHHRRPRTPPSTLDPSRNYYGLGGRWLVHYVLPQACTMS